MEQLDLHGVGHARVRVKVEDFILLNDTPLSIITGNSPMLQRIVFEVLDKYGMKYVVHAHNLGEIVVLA